MATATNTSESAGSGPVDRMYVVAQSGGIAAFDLYEDGSITPLPGSPYPSGAGTFSIVASPDRRRLYVAPGLGLGMPFSWKQARRPQLATFRVRDDGTLEEAAEPIRLPWQVTAVGMAISPDGRNLYVGVGRGPAGMFKGAIARFRIDDDGLPHLAGVPISMGTARDGIPQLVLTPDGTTLYVADTPKRSVLRFAVGEDGALSGPLQSILADGEFPITPVLSRDGRFFYVPNERSESITGYRVGDDGSLARLADSPYPAEKFPHNPVAGRDGRFVYFANTMSDSITAYEIGPDGALAHLPGSPYPTLPGPAMLSLSTDGTRLYLVSSPIFVDGSHVVITSYRIQADGTIVRSEHPPTPTGLRFADGPSSVILPIEA
ncbi:lactonase family protein [Microbacterium sp. No. 7]|uniref:lactonase family protein n=1 Tax=Microbacterium sp. No. 7 TaxID=1714373 RepID=UPI0006D03954|nr:beta-propeller fold lactonase family protein [Microbacterium sp. No. 7]ALJ19809.1 hypothetical protein AOA12_07775 [Microbacterium sp. No. 7]